MEPGFGVRDRLRVAIQNLSDDPDRRVVLTAAGWHKTDAGYLFAHAGGAIGPDGPADGPHVELRPNLPGCRFDQVAEDGESSPQTAAFIPDTTVRRKRYGPGAVR